MNPLPRYRVEQSGPDAFRIYDSLRDDSQLRGLTLAQAYWMADGLNKSLAEMLEVERDCELAQSDERWSKR